MLIFVWRIALNVVEKAECSKRILIGVNAEAGKPAAYQAERVFGCADACLIPDGIKPGIPSILAASKFFSCYRFVYNDAMQFFYSERYDIQLPPGHPFPIEKYRQTKEAVLNLGIADRLEDPGLSTMDELLLVHTRDYLSAFTEGTLDREQLRKIGFPWSPELVARSFAAAAGTLRAAECVLSKSCMLAANLAGGTHHAFPGRGAGYCIINDVAVAVRNLQKANSSMRIMIVDLDAHQGNGTHFILSADPQVFTYSAHVAANYPVEKHNGTFDLEFERWVKGSEYLFRMKETLSQCLAQFRPELVFYLAGVDVHEDDRYGQMSLSTSDMAERDRFAIRSCIDAGARVVTVLAGGYNKNRAMTADLHVQTLAIARDIDRSL